MYRERKSQFQASKSAFSSEGPGASSQDGFGSDVPSKELMSRDWSAVGVWESRLAGKAIFLQFHSRGH